MRGLRPTGPGKAGLMGPTILVVEDDPNDAYFLQRGLSKSGAAVSARFVDDGEQAIAYLSGVGKYQDRQAHPLPMLVFLDLKLPRLSGHEVLEWIRQQPLLRRLPVIVLTSSAAEADINQAYDSGANSYVVKPSGLQEMIDLLTAVQQFWLTHHRRPALNRQPADAQLAVRYDAVMTGSSNQNLLP